MSTEETDAALRRERDEALARVRDLEHQVGALRAELKRLESAMWRRVARKRFVVSITNRLRGR